MYAIRSYYVSLIAGRTDPERLAVVAVRGPAPAESDLPDHVRVLGTVPDDANVCSLDQQGRSLWDVPGDSPALAACRQLVAALG